MSRDLVTLLLRYVRSRNKPISISELQLNLQKNIKICCCKFNKILVTRKKICCKKILT